MNDYVIDNSENTILGIPALVNKKTKETIIVGKYGMIWEYCYDCETGKRRYFIMVDSPKIANEHLTLTDKLKDGEEAGKVVSESEAKLWIKTLKISKNRVTQLDYYNGRNK